MNVKEIKKHAKKFKGTWQFFHKDTKWAADTILQLVAEVERLQIHYNATNKIFKSVQDHNFKLTAANKILRDGLEYYGNPKNWETMDMSPDEHDEYPDYENLNPEKPRLVTGGKTARKALAEADEVLK